MRHQRKVGVHHSLERQCLQTARAIPRAESVSAGETLILVSRGRLLPTNQPVETIFEYFMLLIPQMTLRATHYFSISERCIGALRRDFLSYKQSNTRDPAHMVPSGANELNAGISAVRK
ncbi:hypothetical protein KC349_g145 [Hortaea werneckii]|nr:hypothetical protein KC349_g145 [Hortaea werneckii]